MILPIELENNPTWTAVAALALFDKDGRCLLHLRPADKRHGGLWEFPGGKVEPGETPAEGLVREIREEIGIEVAVGDFEPVAFAQESGQSAHRPIVILLYSCNRWVGEPAALEGGGVGWFAQSEMPGLDMPPLDVMLARNLRC